MPSGGKRPGAGRPRKVAVQPDFEKILAGQAAAKQQAELAPAPPRDETIALKELVAARADVAADIDADADDAEEQAELPPFAELEPLSLRRMAGEGGESDVTNERPDLTTEQIVMLMKSPHVSRVTRKTISYTKAFKEEFFRRYCDGEPPSAIFASCGLDPDVLGQTRIYGLCSTLRSLQSKGLPIPEGRPPIEQAALRIPKRRPRQSATDVFASLSADDVHKLYQRVVYLTQEMEFLKKIMLLDREEGSK